MQLKLIQRPLGEYTGLLTLSSNYSYYLQSPAEYTEALETQMDTLRYHIPIT